MRYLLDSDIVTDLYDKSATNHPKIAERLASLNDSDEVCISILTLYEFEYGFANAPADRKPAVRAKISEAQTDFTILPLSFAGASFFGAMKHALRHHRGLTGHGSKKHNIDLILAASALAEGCVLVSSDSIYEDVRKSHPELALERWVPA